MKLSLLMTSMVALYPLTSSVVEITFRRGEEILNVCFLFHENQCCDARGTSGCVSVTDVSRPLTVLGWHDVGCPGSERADQIPIHGDVDIPGAYESLSFGIINGDVLGSGEKFDAPAEL
jgi:hypothetical protein